jgi:hypothetical protein
MKKPMQWFKIPKPEDPAKQFVGRTLIAYPTAHDAKYRINGEKVEIQTIRGNMRHPTMFEINGFYLVSMLDAYCTLNGQPLFNQETHEDFLSTVVESIIPDHPAKTLIDAGPKRIKFDG